MHSTVHPQKKFQMVFRRYAKKPTDRQPAEQGDAITPAANEVRQGLKSSLISNIEKHGHHCIISFSVKDWLQMTGNECTIRNTIIHVSHLNQS